MITMRSACTWLAGTVLTGALLCAAPGCGGESALEKTPEVTKKQTPEADMPGFTDMQSKLQSKTGKK